MKNVFSVLIALLLSAGVVANMPNEKVLKAFTETFTSVENVKWEDHDDYFTVSFKTGSIRSKVFYDTEGVMLGSIRYYAPEQLPLHILNQLKRQNKTKKLFCVTEVTSGNTVTCFVKLQDAAYWYTLRVEANGDSSLYEKYRKNM
jgi:hypothetical protein